MLPALQRATSVPASLYKEPRRGSGFKRKPGEVYSTPGPSLSLDNADLSLQTGSIFKGDSSKSRPVDLNQVALILRSRKTSIETVGGSNERVTPSIVNGTDEDEEKEEEDEGGAHDTITSLAGVKVLQKYRRQIRGQGGGSMSSTITSDSMTKLENLFKEPLLEEEEAFLSDLVLSPEDEHEEVIEEKVVFSPPDGGDGWLVVLGTFLALFCTTGIIKSMGIVFAEMTRVDEESEMAVFVTMSALAASSTATAPMSTALCQRFNCRVVMCLGACLAFVGLGATAAVPRTELVPVTLGVIAGIGLGLSATPGLILTARYFDKKQTVANAVCLLGSSTGSLLMPVLIQYLLASYGLKGTLVVLGSCLLHLFVSAMLYRPLAIHAAITTNQQKTLKRAQGMNRIKVVQDPDVDLRGIEAESKRNSWYVGQPSQNGGVALSPRSNHSSLDNISISSSASGSSHHHKVASYSQYSGTGMSSTKSGSAAGSRLSVECSIDFCLNKSPSATPFRANSLSMTPRPGRSFQSSLYSSYNHSPTSTLQRANSYHHHSRTPQNSYQQSFLNTPFESHVRSLGNPSLPETPYLGNSHHPSPFNSLKSQRRTHHHHLTAPSSAQSISLRELALHQIGSHISVYRDMILGPPQNKNNKGLERKWIKTTLREMKPTSILFTYEDMLMDSTCSLKDTRHPSHLHISLNDHHSCHNYQTFLNRVNKKHVFLAGDVHRVIDDTRLTFKNFAYKWTKTTSMALCASTTDRERVPLLGCSKIIDRGELDKLCIGSPADQVSGEDASVNPIFQCLVHRLFLSLTISAMSMSLCTPLIPFILPTYLQSTDLVPSSAYILLAIISIFDLAGRFTFSFFLDLRLFPPYVGYSSAILLTGITVLLFPCSSSLVSLSFCSAGYGLGVGFWNTALPLLITEYVGLSSLTTSYSLLRAGQSLGCFAGPLMAGLFRLYGGSWSSLFYLAGGGAMTGAILILIPFPVILKFSQSKKSDTTENKM